MKTLLRKMSSKYKLWLLCLLIFWGIGTIFMIFIMGWGGNKNEDQRLYLSYPYEHNKLPPPDSFKMQKISKYCNHPAEIGAGQEGQIKGNFTLVMVSTIIRHGDRAPLQPVRNLSSIPCIVKPNAKNSNFEKYLKVMSDLQTKLMKEGDFPLYPSDECSLGAMTRQGALQLTKLGAALSDVYNKRWKLLKKQWLSEHIKVYSTVIARTYQSSLAFMYGFLPSFDMNKLNVTPVYGVHFSLRSQYTDCPIIKELHNELRKKRYSMLDSHPAVTRLIKHLHPIVLPDSRYFSKESVKPLFDSFIFYVCHGTHLPCLPKSTHCATFEHVRNLLAFVEWEGRQSVEDPVYIKYSWLQIYGLLFDLHKKMVDLINGKKPHRFVLYSGHDVTLEPLLAVLGFGDGMRPPFASRIVFELYASTEHNQLQARHILRVIYNGKDMTKFTNFCKEYPPSSKRSTGGRSTSRQMDHCSFEKFTYFLRHKFSEITNAKTYKEACKSSVDPGNGEVSSSSSTTADQGSSVSTS